MTYTRLALGQCLVGGCVLGFALACGPKADKNATADSTTAIAAKTDTAAAATEATPTPAESASTTSTSGAVRTDSATSQEAASHATSGHSSASPSHHESTATGMHRSTKSHVSERSSTARVSTDSSSSGAKGTVAPSTSSDTNPPRSGTSSGTSTSDTSSRKDTSAAKTQTSGKGDPLLVSDAEYDGWKMFHVYCYRCHGVDAMGGGIAPNLRHSVSPEGSVNHEVFVTTVKEGRLPKGMPSWKQLLDDKQIEDLWAYLQARSSGRLAPGRPHTAGKKS